jgi:hypothetical protein
MFLIRKLGVLNLLKENTYIRTSVINVLSAISTYGNRHMSKMKTSQCQCQRDCIFSRCERGG